MIVVSSKSEGLTCACVNPNTFTCSTERSIRSTKIIESLLSSGGT
jgi:hypothetical protein